MRCSGREPGTRSDGLAFGGGACLRWVKRLFVEGTLITLEIRAVLGLEVWRAKGVCCCRTRFLDVISLYPCGCLGRSG